MANWQCIQGCGACCYLNPAERPELDQYLSPQELELYLSLLGPTGWCIHFDAVTRSCQIYEDRPRFCRVTPEVFQDLYEIEPAQLNDFAIDCCREQIQDVYGEDSLESLRFERAIA